MAFFPKYKLNNLAKPFRAILFSWEQNYDISPGTYNKAQADLCPDNLYVISDSWSEAICVVRN